MAKSKKKKSKKKLTKNQQELKKQLKRIKRTTNLLTKQGFSVEYKLPTTDVARVSKKLLNELAKIKPKDIRAMSFKDLGNERVSAQELVDAEKIRRKEERRNQSESIYPTLNRVELLNRKFDQLSTLDANRSGAIEHLRNLFNQRMNRMSAKQRYEWLDEHEAELNEELNYAMRYWKFASSDDNNIRLQGLAEIITDSAAASIEFSKSLYDEGYADLETA